MRRTTPTVTLLTTALLALCLGGGCGSSGSGSGPDYQAYDNAQYAFSIQYDAARFTIKSALGSQIRTGAKPGFRAGFVPTSAPAAGKTLTLYVVQVTPYASPWTPQRIAAQQAVFTRFVAAADARTGGKLVGPFRETVGGAPAYRVEGVVTTSGTEVHMRVHFVFHGKNEYELAEQAAAADWPTDGPAFQRMTASFTLLD